MTTIRIGDIVHVSSEPDNSFYCDYRGWPRRWRVDSYLKPAMFESTFLFGVAQKCGPDKCKLQWCSQEEAVYLSLVGVCGAIVKVSDCMVVDRVSWTDEFLKQAESSANRLIGQAVV